MGIPEPEEFVLARATSSKGALTVPGVRRSSRSPTRSAHWGDEDDTASVGFNDNHQDNEDNYFAAPDDDEEEEEESDSNQLPVAKKGIGKAVTGKKVNKGKGKVPVRLIIVS
jgi:hypothetical protein